MGDGKSCYDKGIMKTTLFLCSLALLLVGGGCANSLEISDTDVAMRKGSIEADSRIHFEKTAFATGNATLTFSLYGEDGAELSDSDLKIAHEKYVHFILVRNDMTGYQHLHPAYSNGSWSVATTIPQEGAYTAYVDIVPRRGEAVVFRKSLEVGSAKTQPNFPVLTEGMTTIVNGVAVALETVPALKTGEEIELTFRLTKDGAAVTNIESYLGAYGHVVALRHDDPEVYLHAHPKTENTPTDGRVTFTTTFLETSGYTFFAQFNIGGEIMAFPITVNVEEGAVSSGAPSVGGHKSVH